MRAITKQFGLTECSKFYLTNGGLEPGNIGTNVTNLILHVWGKLKENTMLGVEKKEERRGCPKPCCRWRWLVVRERNASGEPITGIESFTDCLPLQSTTAGPFRLFFSRTQRRRPQMICCPHLPGSALCRAGQAAPHSTPALINNFLVAVCAGEVFTISPYNLGS